MIDPGFNDQRTNGVDDHDSVVVLSSDSKNKLVALMPCSQILPVTRVSIYSDITLIGVLCSSKS
jgi:hypothetical protein